MNRKRPEYPTLLELIRGRVKNTAIAGSGAAIIAVGCGDSTAGTDDTGFPDFSKPDIHDVPVVDITLEFPPLGGKDPGQWPTPDVIEDLFPMVEDEGLNPPGIPGWDPGPDDAQPESALAEAETQDPPENEDVQEPDTGNGDE